ncbi:MAG: hypothetical protein V4450_02540 [Bacteroidota bacterium]
MLDNNYVILIGVVLVGVLAYFFFLRDKPKAAPIEKPVQAGSVSLQLQAYERMILLVDRIAIPNLVGRTSYDALTARDMQLVLTRTIRDEFDYNITQQIYITPEAWNAVKSLKEKNLLIINQVAAQLPPSASGLDLNRSLLEYLMSDEKANLHELVSQALSFEAKKLL